MKPERTEHWSDLKAFLRDGVCPGVASGARPTRRITLGRTWSKRGLGFEIEDMSGTLLAEFVLDREQVEFLRSFCDYSILRMTPQRGVNRKVRERRRQDVQFMAWFGDRTRRLQRRTRKAARSRQR